MVVRDSWLGSFRRVYLQNPSATRDLRVQLRGNRAMILFGVYLVVMAIVLMLVYDGVSTEGRTSLATAQQSLESFYYTTLGCLGLMISLVAPAIGAFAVVQERQRRSLDLVFSAPVEPRMYLVGKLISSYRYVWLLLILSLPFCAVSVTLGGATWPQLFLTFFMFSIYGLYCTAIGLFFSVSATKTLPAVIWTYLAVFCHFVTGLSLLGVGATPFGGTSSSIATPWGILSPVAFPFMQGQSTPILGMNVPLWLLSLLAHMLIIKFLILGAGTQLAPATTNEIRKLRIHVLVYASALSATAGNTVCSVVATMAGAPWGDNTQMAVNDVVGKSLFGVLMVMMSVVVPNLASMSSNDLRRHRPEPMLQWRKWLSGEFGGHLPFILILFATGLVSFACGFLIVSRSISMPILVGGVKTAVSKVSTLDGLLSVETAKFCFLSFAFSMFAFAVGVFCVSKRGALSVGRTASLFGLILLVLVPSTLLGLATPEKLSKVGGLWALNPFCSLLIESSVSPGLGWAHALALLAIAYPLLRVTAQRIQVRKQEFEQ
jgi:ABC-type transport system involved in multi-copper enzyme maturation permease subunit